jgi:hypothetical protein
LVVHRQQLVDADGSHVDAVVEAHARQEAADLHVAAAGGHIVAGVCARAFVEQLAVAVERSVAVEGVAGKVQNATRGASVGALRAF